MVKCGELQYHHWEKVTALNRNMYCHGPMYTLYHSYVHLVPFICTLSAIPEHTLPFLSTHCAIPVYGLLYFTEQFVTFSCAPYHVLLYGLSYLAVQFLYFAIRFVVFRCTSYVCKKCLHLLSNARPKIRSKVDLANGNVYGKKHSLQ